MKRKAILSIALAGMLAFGAGLGTMAYFTKTFVSQENTITAATFDVDSNGTLDTNAVFDFDNAYPGYTGFYEFQVDKSATEVPVQYVITFTPNGELFGFNEIQSALRLGLQRSMNGKTDNNKDLQYVVNKGRGTIQYTVPADFDIETFRLVWDWPHGNNDNAFQGRTGSVKINVVAEQIPETTILADVVITNNVASEGGSVRYPAYDPEDKSTYAAQNRVVTRGNKLFIFDNAYYGDVQLKIEGSTATIISSSEKPELQGYTYSINRVSSGWLHLRNDNSGARIIEIDVPGGSVDSIFE